MIEVFFLLLLIGSSSAAINLFKDGDFEAFVGNNVNPFIDSWYCGVGTKMDFWVEDIGNDKAVLIDLICLKICQNVTTGFEGLFSLSLLAASPSSSSIRLTVNGLILVEKEISNTTPSTEQGLAVVGPETSVVCLEVSSGVG